LRNYKKKLNKIGKLIRNEKLFYVSSDISKLVLENKKNNHRFFAEFDLTTYNLHYFSTKFLLKKTLFKNYGFLFKDSFYLLLPCCFTSYKFERALNSIDLVGLKLNNKLYLKNERFNFFLESISYEKSVFSFVSFLRKCLKIVFILYRNDVN
jgi:hypothetical protein